VNVNKIIIILVNHKILMLIQHRSTKSNSNVCEQLIFIGLRIFNYNVENAKKYINWRTKKLLEDNYKLVINHNVKMYPINIDYFKSEEFSFGIHFKNNNKTVDLGEEVLFI
jgi:hypothetical protein